MPHLYTTSLLIVLVPFLASATPETPLMKPRKANYPINPLFLQRQSHYSLQRTLSPEQMKKKLNCMFEAARWAPSSYNNQPWRYIYAIHGTPAWKKLFNLLVPFNQEWVQNAGALLLVISSTKYEHNGQDATTHSFDTGLASMQLMLEATTLGLVAHGMSGFDAQAARKDYKIPQNFSIEAMIAIGEVAPEGKSRKEFMERDAKVATRKKISEFAFEGEMPKS